MTGEKGGVKKAKVISIEGWGGPVDLNFTL